LALHYPEDLWKKAKQTAQAELNHLQHYIQQHSDDPEQRQFAQQIPEIFYDWETLLPKIENNSFFERQNRFPKLAVYNNFWHTLGGGEHHACVIAQALESLGPVDLISENDFSIEKLEQQFNIRLKQCRKRLVSSQQMHHDPATTSQYDVFVNSTYSSNLISHAKHSYYVVSFPYKIPSYPVEGKEFLKSYELFLANSRYTAGWVKQWWDVDNCEVVYPSIAIPDIVFDQIKKITNILHVGRFFRSGHNKKQLELVRVFKHLLDSGKVDNGWTLTLVGQVDPTQQAYLNEVLEEAQGYPIEILNNVALESLRKLYEESAIYWHATGLGESNERSPERNEHFGISTVEAMSYGCVPIVINAGGQPESVVHEKNGFLFDNEKQLQAYTMQCIQLFSQAPEQYRQLSEQAIITASNFSRSNTKQSFLHHLSDIVFHWYSEYKLL
jgi:glycosyltransferase involved in cell wall biosynthesis